jgi:clan AA aspartic protease (TIGR02281 family)
MENTIKDLQERSIARVIPLKKAGEHYLAEVQIDELYSLSLMLDTGASMTVVKDEFVLRELPELLYDSEALNLKTANGLVQGRKILVQRFSMTDLTLNDVSIAVLPLQEFSYDGLLGMNVLGRFEFRIDQERQELILHSK